MISGGNVFFSYPSGIHLNNANNTFYIADMHNHRVCWMKEDGSTDVLSNIVAGDDSCSSLGRPLAVWVADQGKLFAADAEHKKIFCKYQQEDVWRSIKVDLNYYFNFPGGVAVDENGNVYTNDFLNNRLVKIALDGEITVLWEGKKNIDKFYGIFYQNNKLYYTDTGNARICYVDLKSGQMHILQPQIEEKKLTAPIALTLDKEDNIYICEQRSMYYLDNKSNILSLVADRNIWKEQMTKYLINDRICHMGAITVRCKGEIYWVDTIKGCIYKMVLKFS